MDRIAFHRFIALLAVALLCGCGRRPREAAPTPLSAPPQATGPGSCFLLYELSVGEVRRAPSSACNIRVTPASTFKIPHALAALDSGVVGSPDETFHYDGSPVPFPTWRRDHTLATAMRYSVVWVYQIVADRLGPRREREYLDKFTYGNRDSSGRPRRFWIGDSLRISPNEQLDFLVRFYEGKLPVSEAATRGVQKMLVQPRGFVVNAAGEHPFGTWHAGTELSAKTGSDDAEDASGVRWIVGHVHRQARSWVFVSMVTGRNLEPFAAVDLAAQALTEGSVL